MRGAWVAQSVKCPPLDSGSGHDLMVMRSSLKSVQHGGYLGFSLSLSLCPSPANTCVCAHALFFSLSKKQTKQNKTKLHMIHYR